MSTFAELRTAWESWSAAAVPQVQVQWTNDPQALAMKLPVVLEIDGPTTLSNTSAQDYVGYANSDLYGVQGTLRAHRLASMFLRVTSRDNITHPAELTIERVRAALRREDLRHILSKADCSVLSVGTTVRYPVTVSGRRELVTAVEVRIGWRWDDEDVTGPEGNILIGPVSGTIESADIVGTIYTEEVNMGASQVWGALSVLAVTNPLTFGAVGDGVANDLPAMKAAVNALPAAGGVVFLPAGKTFRKDDLFMITKNHVKFWSVNRTGGILSTVPVTNKQALQFRPGTIGGGVFGVRFTSDAVAPFRSREDNQISLYQCLQSEVVGNDFDNPTNAGIQTYGANGFWIQGNYVHDTWGDHIHFSFASKNGYVWENWTSNGATPDGDDGIAIAAEGNNETTPRCENFEVWNNVTLFGNKGRGYVAAGVNNAFIHHNWAVDASAAGIYVVSEIPSKNPGSNNVRVYKNNVVHCARLITAHPGIFVNGGNPLALPLVDIVIEDNISINNVSGQAYRQQGNLVNVTETLTNSRTLTAPIPTVDDVELTDTAVLKTRDISYVPEARQRGLYRIHVRQNPRGPGYQQRFEYVFKGPGIPYVRGAYALDSRLIGGVRYTALLVGTPITLPASHTAVTFADLRAGDLDGSLTWLWHTLEETNY